MFGLKPEDAVVPGYREQFLSPAPAGAAPAVEEMSPILQASVVVELATEPMNQDHGV